MILEEIEKQSEEYFCEHCENSFEHDNGHCSNCSKWDNFIAGAKWGYIKGQTSMYSDLCKERERICKELIVNFTEQLGLLDKEDDELFSLKAIKSVIKYVTGVEG